MELQNSAINLIELFRLFIVKPLASQLNINQNMTITGNGVAKTIIDGNSSNRVFWITSTANIESLTIQNGSAAEDGGGIDIVTDQDITVNISNATITGNTATLNGGGINLSLPEDVFGNVELNISNSTISGNIAQGQGGGIYAKGSSGYYSIINVENSTISGNTAGQSGGGIHNQYGTISSLSNSTISGNGASDYGGGIENYGTLTVTDCTISGNTANTAGGGIENDSTLTVTDCAISENTAGLYGGGIENYYGTLTVTDCTISGNTAGRDGGGIYNYGISTLSNSTISGNEASDNGGGIYNNDTIYLANTIVINNTATNGGGDIYTSDTSTSNVYYSWYELISGPIITQPTAPNVTDAYTVDDLAGLADNGGPTETMEVSHTAPAYQAGHYVYYNATDGYYIYDNQDPPAAHKVSDWSAPSIPQTSDKITTDQRGWLRDDPTTIGAYDENPTLIELTSFTAKGFQDRVTLTWETASELDNAGFHIRRSETKGSGYERITDSLIPAQGSPTQGTVYTFDDMKAQPGKTYFYQMEDVDTNGKSTFHGPVSITIASRQDPTPIPAMSGVGILLTGAALAGSGAAFLRRRRRKS